MNAFYVTVSIPLLLVLAGFNHAHGLSTFGIKSSNQPQVQGKHCTSQANCTLILGTTCLRSFCLCGDNTHPSNGVCRVNIKKGARHICQNDDECVTGADCVDASDTGKPNTALATATYKTCQCQEGLSETPAGTCSGVRNSIVLPGLLLITTIIVKIY